MAVLLSPKLYLAQYDLSGYANQLDSRVAVSVKNPMTFADAGMKRVQAGGDETVTLKGKVFWQTDSAAFKSHDLLRANWKLTGVPVSWSPQTGASGDMVQFFKALHAAYAFGGQIGDLLLADVEAVSDGQTPNVYGTVLEVGSKNAGGNSTARLLGLVGATQRLYALLHIVSISGGGTLTVKVQSDDAVGFPSAADRITFTGATVAGWQWLELAGAIATDTYWRANWTLSAGTAVFAVHVGIL
jgi:hypothetical protein